MPFLELPESTLAAMAAFYRRADAELASMGPLCGACGGCCRFDIADHILYASSLERAYLLALAPAPPSPEGGGIAELVAAGRRCPYQSGNACLAREGRTLGCRSHCCEWRDPEGAENAAERLHGELKRLHERLGAAWDYRPLLPL